MPKLSSSFVVPGYALIGASGTLFTLVPPTSVSAFYIHNNILFIEVFGAFFAIGGVVAFLASFFRRVVKVGTLATWHFERAGLFLIISASSIYTWSLIRRGFETEDINTFALGLLIFGVTFLLIARLMETFKRTKLLSEFERKKDAR